MNKEQTLRVVQIDDTALDKECVGMPTHYYNAAYEAAEAKRDVAELSNELKVVEATLRQEIRSNPAEFGLEKVTESAISEMVPSQAKYSKAQTALTDAQHRSDIAQALVWALEHKKRALTLLVDLHGMSYFSKPRVSDKGKAAFHSDRAVQSTRRRSSEEAE